MSFLNSIISSVVSLFKTITAKPSWTQIMSSVVPQIFMLVDQGISAGKLSTKEKLDDFLETMDLRTGVDAQALDMFKDITAAAEEEFFDGLIKALRAYGYAKIGVPGYIEITN